MADVQIAVDGQQDVQVALSTISETQIVASLPTLIADKIGDLQDVDVSGVAAGQVLQWNGSKWVSVDFEMALYFATVERVDGQALEPEVRDAISQFVAGCKSDGIWDAIKACCILAGARTLSGALVPLKGAAPTNFNFVAGDYNRKTGLVGNGTTKYLNSNRANNADPQNSSHNAVYISTAETSGNFGIYIGAGDIQAGANNLGRASIPATDFLFRSRVTGDLPSFAANEGGATGFAGMSRSSSANFIGRVSGASATYTNTSSPPVSNSVLIFRRESAGITTARLSFYSIGESLDLALFDARVTQLMTDLATAIP